MALAVIPRPHDAPRTSVRSSSTKVDPRFILRLWHQETIRSGKRGAYKRVGERVGLSDERIRQIVADDEDQRWARGFLAVLLYVELRRSRWQTWQAQICQHERKHRQAESDRRPLTRLIEHNPQPSIGYRLARLDVSRSLQIERPYLAVATLNDADVAARMAFALAVLVTGGLLLIAARHTMLALALLPPALGLWHMAAVAQRLRRGP